jgi:hypothetical protein
MYVSAGPLSPGRDSQGLQIKIPDHGYDADRQNPVDLRDQRFEHLLARHTPARRQRVPPFGAPAVTS